MSGPQLFFPTTGTLHLLAVTVAVLPEVNINAISNGGDQSDVRFESMQQRFFFASSPTSPSNPARFLRARLGGG